MKAIFAVDSSGGIGNKGSLPWPKHADDLAWFKEHTLNNIVVMGKNTWKDKKMPKPLKDRINVVVTNNPPEDALARYSTPDNLTETLITLKESFPEKEIFVIGGKQVLEWLRPEIKTIYLTRFKGRYYTDTRLDLNSFLTGFRLMSVKPGDNCTFEVWEKITFPWKDKEE
jgi:dihydrofolate reductase